MTRRMKTAAAILLAVVAAGRAAAAPSLRVSANRDSIYIGESFILSVLVEGSRIEEPDLSSLAGGAVRLLGSQERSNYSISFANGRMTRTGFSGREFTYEVTPAASGDFRAGPVTATVDGARLSDPGPLVRVQGMEEQDTVRIRVSSTRNAVLVDEPFEITVGIAIRRLDGRFAELDP
ncbi:MAG: protein BatD, partial [Lentisphaerae bacterium]|nr:protein BatD [Lentisphaerota bacterium]